MTGNLAGVHEKIDELPDIVICQTTAQLVFAD